MRRPSIRKKEVTKFVDTILQEQKIDIQLDSEEYKRFCKSALEMLYRLDLRKSAF
ncbi:MAG: hypothetical protein KAR13_21240 [Desulfobulbaceae bacterium]|nr:hypothetical protein [Desulfobulbaceae bacterium]